MKEYFHPLQHMKMFKLGIISVFCESKDASERLRNHFRNAGYIEWANGEDTTVDRYKDGWYYCTLLDSIGRNILCMDAYNCAEDVFYYK